jgi:YhhN family
MAVVAAGLNWRVGVGGLLFFVSDGLIAAGIAGKTLLPEQGVWVMATYYAALVLIATGVTHKRT